MTDEPLLAQALTVAAIVAAVIIASEI